ncbi:Smr/MutS family protein [Terasakiella sp. SH-1]|uniref:Smr/MutS family protein n=1 Tax=Terasakiella sp. SH-1 TaxID=2560057 RepID=UPI001073D245|nr:Smr/MutS family protein [Terasakiella sp. SH-1]
MAKKAKYVEQPEKRTRGLSVGETQLWKKVTDDVEALPGRFVDLDGADPIPEPVATRPYPDTAKPLETIRADESHKSFDPLHHGKAAGVDKRTMDRLRRGKMPMEGRLDLHGMTQDQAHSALLRFINSAFGQGKRCVSVITGKGTQLNGKIGVLREMVPHWLNQPGLRSKIIAFTYAPKNEGGEGALYILLKRWR